MVSPSMILKIRARKAAALRRLGQPVPSAFKRAEQWAEEWKGRAGKGAIKSFEKQVQQEVKEVKVARAGGRRTGSGKTYTQEIGGKEYLMTRYQRPPTPQEREKAKVLTPAAQQREFGGVIHKTKTRLEVEAETRGISPKQLSLARELKSEAREKYFGEMIGGMSQRDYVTYQKARAKEASQEKVREYPSYYFPSRLSGRKQKLIEESKLPRPVTYIEPAVVKRMELALKPTPELKEAEIPKGKYEQFLYSTRKKLETFELGRATKEVSVGGEKVDVLLPTRGAERKLAGLGSALLYPIRSKESTKALAITGAKAFGFTLGLSALEVVSGPIPTTPIIMAVTSYFAAKQIPKLQAQISESKLRGPVAYRETISEFGTHLGVGLAGGYAGSRVIPAGKSLYKTYRGKRFAKKVAIKGEYQWHKEGVSKRPLSSYEKTLVESKLSSPQLKEVIFARAGGKVATAKVPKLGRGEIQTQLFPKQRIITRQPPQPLKPPVYRDYWNPERGVRSYLGQYTRLPKQVVLPKVIDITTGQRYISPSTTRQIKLTSSFGELRFGTGFSKGLKVPTTPSLISRVKTIKLFSGRKGQLSFTQQGATQLSREKMWKFKPSIEVFKPTVRVSQPLIQRGGSIFGDRVGAGFLSLSASSQDLLNQQGSSLGLAMLSISASRSAQGLSSEQLSISLTKQKQLQLQSQAQKQMQASQQRTDQVLIEPTTYFPQIFLPKKPKSPKEIEKPIEIVPPGLPLWPGLPRLKRKRIEKVVRKGKRRQPPKARYAASIYGVDVFKSTGFTIGREPSFVGAGARFVTKGMAQQLGTFGTKKSKKKGKKKKQRSVFNL